MHDLVFNRPSKNTNEFDNAMNVYHSTLAHTIFTKISMHGLRPAA